MLSKINLSDKNKKVILLMACFCFIALICTRSMVDYDFWFHYDCGRYIVTTGQIPTTAIGSWYGLENNLPWISHEWLFGLLVYYIAELIGINALPFIAGLSMASICTLIIASNIKKEINYPFMTFIITMLFSFTCIGGSVIRPQLFLYLFTILLYFILDKELENPSNEVLWLVPLTVLWVNLHGGSYILLFFFSGLFFLLDLFKFKLGRLSFKGAERETHLKRFGILFVCLFLVSFNAHGLSMYNYPFVNMSDSVMLQTISEWQPLNLNNGQLIFLLIPAIYFIMILVSKQELKGHEVLFAVILLGMSLKAVRFSIQLNMISTLLIFKHIDMKEKKTQFAYLIIFPLIIIGSIFMYITNASKIYYEPFDTTILPSENLIVTIKEDQPERLYNHYNAGGYLLYNNIPTFIDGRADIYSNYNTLDFFTITDCKFKFEDKLKEYNFDGFLVMKNENLYTYLSEHPEQYTLMDEDGYYSYFILDGGYLNE